MDDQQRKVAHIALEATGDYGFALAGSGAIQEHHLTNRLTRDVDLFTDTVGNFDTAVDSATQAWQEAGYSVTELRRAPEFCNALVEDRAGHAVEVDFGRDWRAEASQTLAVGPVLSPEDAVGSKVGALYSRGETRDYIDVDSIRQSGRFSDETLLQIAENRDPGFERQWFGQALQSANSHSGEAFAEYGVTPEQAKALKERTTTWGDSLQATTVNKDSPDSSAATEVQKMRAANYPTSAADQLRSGRGSSTQEKQAYRKPAQGRDRGYSRD